MHNPHLPKSDHSFRYHHIHQLLSAGPLRGGDRGVSYPGPRDNGGASQCFRMNICNHLSRKQKLIIQIFIFIKNCATTFRRRSIVAHDRLLLTFKILNRRMFHVILFIFTARCTLVQSAVLRSHVVCLSVCLSVCL